MILLIKSYICAIILIVVLLFVNECNAIDTEKALFKIHNKTENTINYSFEYLNHSIKEISPFEKFLCAGGEVKTGKIGEVVLDGYPVGAKFKVTVFSRNNSEMYLNQIFILKSIKNEINIYIKNYE